MKKAILILLLSISFFVFNLQLVDAQPVAPWRAPWRYNQDFIKMVNKLESTWSLWGLEVSDYKKVPFELVVSEKDNYKIGLTEERIRTKCELRLRQAGLEPMPTKDIFGNYLSIHVSVLANAFSINTEFSRSVLFEAKGTAYLTMASTWIHRALGTHGGSPEYIIKSLDEGLDSFLNEYLKANAK